MSKNSFISNMEEEPADGHQYNGDSVYQLPIMSKSQTLALLSSNEIRVGALIWKPTGLQVDGIVTREDWEQTGKLLKQLDSSMQWLIGDLIVCGEDLKWGDQKTIAESFGFEYGTIRNYAYVCRKVEMSIRSDKLDFAHHQLVAALPVGKQIFWLNAAEKGDDGKRWSVSRLRDAINGTTQLEAETTPKYLHGVSQIRQAYSPAKRRKMKPAESRRVISELKGLIEVWEDELDG